MKTYLKTSHTKFYTAYAAFDHDNLKSVTVASGSLDFGTNYDDLDHLSEKIGEYLVDQWVFCTREEFNAYCLAEISILNHITKEL